MKYRIVKVTRTTKKTEVYYKIQEKYFIFWRDRTYSRSHKRYRQNAILCYATYEEAAEVVFRLKQPKPKPPKPIITEEVVNEKRI